MFKNLATVSNNKSSVFLLVLALIVGGVGAQATGLLNTASGGYLVCVNTKTKVVTHPGTSSCPQGSKKLVLGAQGAAGAIGLTGATGLSGRDGTNGSDGKTLWNGTSDPVSTWGAPGDMFINSVTKTLFGPKNIDGIWPAGVSMVGPKGDQGLTGLIGLTGAQGPIGLTGAQGPIGLTGAAGAAGPAGPQGPGGANGGSGPAGANGGSGPAGAAGATGATGATGAIGLTGVAEPVVTGANCIGTKCTYKVGDTGPGGGIIFFVDYFDQYVGIKYLEAAPQGWGNNISVNQGGLTGEITGSTTVDPLMKWCSDTTTLLNLNPWSNSGVGKGATNTSTADRTCTGGAIQVAADYAGGSQTWFLPSIGEAMLMYTNLRQAGVGGFVDNNYWSSSEYDASSAWRQGFANGFQNFNVKTNTFYVRPVRAF